MFIYEALLLLHVENAQAGMWGAGDEGERLATLPDPFVLHSTPSVGMISQPHKPGHPPLRRLLVLGSRLCTGFRIRHGPEDISKEIHESDSTYQVSLVLRRVDGPRGDRVTTVGTGVADHQDSRHRTPGAAGRARPASSHRSHISFLLSRRRRVQGYDGVGGVGYGTRSRALSRGDQTSDRRLFGQP